MQQRQRAARALVDHEDATEARQHLVDGLEEEPAPGDARGVAVLGQDGAEALRLTAGPVHALEGVALGLGHELLGLALGARHHLVAPLLGLVDQPLALLLGLVHLVEGRLHALRGRHVLQLDGADRDAHVEGVQDLLQLDLGPGGHLHALLGQHVAAQAVAHDAPHHGLADVADRRRRVAHAVEPGVGVADPVLHDPLDVDHLEVAGQHQRLALLGAGLLVAGARVAARGAEPELLLEHAAGGHEGDPVDPEGQLEVQPRVADRHHGAEALHHRHAFGLDGVDRAPDRERQQGQHREPGAPRPEAVEVHASQPVLEVGDDPRACGAGGTAGRELTHPVDLLTERAITQEP